MKKVDILTAYALVNGAKLTKLEDEAKFKVIKACKAMKPIVEDLKSFESDAQEKLKGENHEQMVELERKKENDTLTDEEIKALNEYSAEYIARVNKCLNDELNAEVALDYERLTADEVKKLVSSNDWNVAQTIAVMAVVE